MDLRVSRNRAVVALAGAVALHGLLLWLLVWLPHPAPGARPGRAITVELREQRSRPDAARGAQAGQSPAPEATLRAGGSAQAPHRSAGKAASRVEEKSAPAAPSAGPSAGGANENLVPWSDPWRRAEGLVSKEGGKEDGKEGGVPLPPGTRFGPGWGISRELRDPGVALGPGKGGSVASGDGAQQGPVHVPSREEALVEEQARVQQGLDTFVKNFQARERVRDVRDSYWQGVENRLTKGFKVDWEILDRGPKTSNAGKAVREAMREFSKEVEAYGQSGSPFAGAPGHVPGERGRLADELTSLPNEDRGFRGEGTLGNLPRSAVDLRMLSEAAFGEGSAWHRRLVVMVRITQRTDGSVENASIVLTSGNRIYDRVALDQAWSLGRGGLLGAPPRDHRESVWAFETDFTQIPPMPIAGCALDDFIPKNCFYPFKKSVFSKIHLEAVY